MITTIENFKTFMYNKGLFERTAKLARKKLIVDSPELTDEQAIEAFVYESAEPRRLVDRLCSWGSQIEGSSFWGSLDAEWRSICKEGAILNKVETYKSIW